MPKSRDLPVGSKGTASEIELSSLPFQDDGVTISLWRSSNEVVLQILATCRPLNIQKALGVDSLMACYGIRILLIYRGRIFWRGQT